MKSILTFLLFVVVSTSYARCGTSPKDSTIVGTWKGTSICQLKNSPCHDEIVVFYLSKLNSKDSFNLAAYKVVNGKEDFMGDLGFVYDAVKQTLVCSDTARDAIWSFAIKGNSIDGTLYVKGVLFRIVKVSR